MEEVEYIHFWTPVLAQCHSLEARGPPSLSLNWPGLCGGGPQKRANLGHLIVVWPALFLA